MGDTESLDVCGDKHRYRFFFLIRQQQNKKTFEYVTCHVSFVTCHLSHVFCCEGDFDSKYIILKYSAVKDSNYAKST